MFRYLYKVKVGRDNTFVFTSLDSAFEWCKKNTVWDNITIRNSIKKVSRAENGDYYVL